MTNEKLFELLKKETNMTDHDIQKHIEDGIMVYENTEAGFADFRNVCIFALPMRLKINRMFPARHAIRKQRTCSYGMKAEQEPVGEHMV